jgi:thiol-disulfide isomerase/thioredoxin
MIEKIKVLEDQMIRKIVITLLSTTLLLTACAPAVATPEVMMEKPTEVMTEKSEDKMMEEPADEMMNESTDEMMEEPVDEKMDESSDGMMEEVAWFGTTFTNVSNGEVFTINDFKGKVVLVENLAMWCSNCKKQQEQVKLLHELLGMNEDLVSIGLDIDTNEKASDLKTYVENNGFDWIYAVASEEVTREIANLYGAQFLNPPSTPILIIDRKGQAHPMPFGIKSAEELKNFIEPFLSESM